MTRSNAPSLDTRQRPPLARLTGASDGGTEFVGAVLELSEQLLLKIFGHR